MKTNEYQVTISNRQNMSGEPLLYFTARSHDDLVSIIAKAQQRTGLNYDDAASLAIGLKLFGNILLENRGNPLFSEMSTALHGFIKKLKRG